MPRVCFAHAVHHNLVLRADNVAEKNQWVSRLRMHTKAAKDTKDAPPPPPAATPQESRETPSDSEASDAEKEKASDKEGEVREAAGGQCLCVLSRG